MGAVKSKGKLRQMPHGARTRLGRTAREAANAAEVVADEGRLWRVHRASPTGACSRWPPSSSRRKAWSRSTAAISCPVYSGSRLMERCSEGTTLATSIGSYAAAARTEAASAEAAFAPLHAALACDAAVTAASITAARRCSRRSTEADWTRRSETAGSSPGLAGGTLRVEVADEGRTERDCATGSAYAGCESELVHRGLGLAGKM